MKGFVLLIILTMSISAPAQLRIKDNVRFLALGDSYTIGESVAETERWPMLLIDSLLKRGLTCEAPKIIATTGWRTDQLKDAIKSASLANEYTLVSLLIGVNNQYQGKSAQAYKAEFEELLNTAIALAQGNKLHVFVVSIPDYGYTPFGKEKMKTISKEIDVFNMINREVTERAGVMYVPITDISRKGFEQPDLVAADGLHPSGKMYAEWVHRILQGVKIVKSADK